MTDNEISMFIDAMNDLSDKWRHEEVKKIYSNYSLSDAITERTKSMTVHLNNLTALINWME